ncbi:hypothetical protein ACQP2Y_45840 [Actinoplanes sp. CA-051413]|uniref:hypothetical protein n=1 Tax=Actinoplanes sp. CA-051413 TaxID=3239899 RepID=UPI003D9921EE
MPGFNDTEAIAVYPTNPGDAFRVPTVEKAAGFDVNLEAEAGNGLIGPNAITPYTAAVQVRNLTQFRPVTVTTAAANAVGTIGVGQPWDTNDERFVFNVAAGSPDVDPGDFVEVLASVSSGNPAGAASNDFSFVRSAVFQVI